MNNIELKDKLVNIAKNYKTLYVMGCFGSPMNATNKKRYTSNHAYNKQSSRKNMINNASSDTFGFDCVNLIKGVLWGWNGNLNHVYGGSVYASNGVPDINADGMIAKCKNISTNFNNITVGEAVWLSGHIGIYIGNGEVVECTPSWKNNVQITKLSQRKWLKHGKLPYITYVNETSATKTIDELAREVIAGKYGAGEARKKALGSQYNEVQKRVNEILKGNNTTNYLGSKGYFTLGDNHKNIGKIAEFMYKTFPAYTKKEALGNYYGKNLQASIKEFQRRTKIKASGNIDSTTVKELEKYGLKK